MHSPALVGSSVRALVYVAQRHNKTVCNNRCDNDVQRAIATRKRVYGVSERRKRKRRQTKTQGEVVALLHYYTYFEIDGD
jgi:hypothetical protein